MKMTLLPDPKPIREYMEIWEMFLDSLASEGGHIALWVSGVLFGTAVVWMGFDILGDRIIAGAITGLGIALKTTASNAKRNSEREATVTVNTSSTSAGPSPTPQN